MEWTTNEQRMTDDRRKEPSRLKTVLYRQSIVTSDLMATHAIPMTDDEDEQ